jgi:SAM-dependent MidA family methyltransferase
MEQALYGASGFFVTGPESPGPAAHFRTSVHASPLFSRAVSRLLAALDEVLGSPAALDLVDVGAGRGELLRFLVARAEPSLRDRLRPVGVELAPRPPDLPADIGWRREPPAAVTGLVVATEWLDNVPLDVASTDASGVVRYECVDGSLDVPVSTEDSEWLARWWPRAGRAEIGLPRDRAWAGVVSTVERGLALCVDYGHVLASRPLFGTLTGFRDGREVPPVPDGTCDLTAHVAMDSLARPTSVLVRQRDALRALGVSGARPPLSLASTDPAGYVRALASASEAAELTDPAGLGGHWWLLDPVGIEINALTLHMAPQNGGVTQTSPKLR